MRENNDYKEEREKIIKGLEEAYRRLIEFKKQKNTPLVVSRNGKIIEIDPHEAPPTTTYENNTDQE